MDPQPYSWAALRPKQFAPNIITITGETGVGTSTAMKKLREVLGTTLWRYESAGGIMRKFAQEKGMTIEEFATYNRDHPGEKWDEKCDQAIREFGRQNHTVIEGRLPHVFVPHAFHVLLVCEPGISAERRKKDMGKTFSQMYALIRKRDEDDATRYQKLYPGCLWPSGDFDLRINTGEDNPDKTCHTIQLIHRIWQREHRRLGSLSDAEHFG